MVDDADMTPEEFRRALDLGEPVVILPFRPDWAPGPHNAVYYDEKYRTWQLTRRPARWSDGLAYPDDGGGEP